MNAPIDMAKFAAQVCGMAQPGRDYQAMPVSKANITSADTAGLYQYDYVGSEGLELSCYLEFEAPIDGGTGPDREESWPARIDLVYALHKGEDISEVLSEDVRGLIETEALADIEAGEPA